MTSTVEQIIDTARTLSQIERDELILALRSLETAGTRRGLVSEVRGKYRHVPTSVDEFLRRKAAATVQESKP